MSNESKLYVYSTLAADVDYTPYVKGGGDLPVAQPAIRIKGGAGVANDRVISPVGVMTEIEADQLMLLRSDAVFVLHEANGYIKLSEKAHEVEAVTGDMQGRDNSAPAIPEDFENEPGPKPAASNKRK